ncbi:MAG: flagellar biosynthetic protein FliR [Deltaproteobacteria bacterium]|nr:flagellar biosynthetic protein FliR [Deltaproteobacteria bacterium]
MTDDALRLLHGPLMALMRCSGLVVTLPLIGTRGVPAAVRAVLALALAAFVFPSVAVAPPPLVQWGPRALGELAIGLAFGLSVRFALAAAFHAGQLAGSAMGFTYAATLDPLSGHEAPAWAQIVEVGALGTAVAMGFHRAVVAWLWRSMELVPVGGGVPWRDLFDRVVETVLGALVLGTQLALPALAAVLAVQLWLAAVGRTAAQLNLSTLGFLATVVVGGVVLGGTTPTLCVTVARSVLEVAAR